ncbi:ATP/GTP-binding protein [Caulobacter sp. FWC2]|uniref:AAA family ATPase n=1 Tax=Caulobacter sp. FWC2 TaxID=69664 RepID=UPI000C15926D|nr:ATP-binding protein [Caulobacter sp. FWC2]PIB91949.1 hypothetical protein CSW62_10405 [Caulobacter sp. FWC2]
MNLALKSFEIRGFKGFEHLRFGSFSQVNLLVGKNNTGKTSILEAIRILVSPDPWIGIAEILAKRDEFQIRRRRKRATAPAVGDYPLAFEALFYGRPDVDVGPRFSLGAVGERPLEVSLVWVRRIENLTDGQIRYAAVSDEGEARLDPDVVSGLCFDRGYRLLMPLERIERWGRRRFREENSNIIYLASSGMAFDELGRIWDAVALTADEDVVVEVLRIIEPRLEKLVLVQSPRSSERLLMAKLSSFPEPIPFRSLGEGIFHVLSIILALIKARSGVLLIDEIENGIHFSVQMYLWAVVISFAKAWNVQVFSTTHSWDCVTGFAAALSQERGDGALFRLEGEAGNITAIPFDSDELRLVSHEHIEVR